jgi:tetratricopeptide (TPR) repeat protein
VAWHALAVLLWRTGRLEEAEQVYPKAEDLLEKLVENCPSQNNYRSALASVYNFAGTLFGGTNQPQKARKNLDRAVTVLEKLVRDYPDAPAHRTELARSLYNLAIVLQDQLKQPEEAEKRYRRANTLGTKLVEVFPDALPFKFDLGQSYNGLGDVLFGPLQRPAEAKKAWEEAVRLFGELTTAAPQNPDNCSHLAVSLSNLARVLLREGKLAEAHELLDTATGHLGAALKSNPRHLQYRSIRQSIQHVRAEVHLEGGGHTEAAQLARELGETASEDATVLYHAARLLSRCVRVAEREESATEGGRGDLSSVYAAQALDLLRSSIEHGFDDYSAIEEDPLFEPLRSLPVFQGLRATLRQKS